MTSKINSRLIIVADKFDGAGVNLHDADFLAMTLLAMESLKQQGIAYITLEDVYSRDEINADSKNFLDSLMQWILACDQVASVRYDIKDSFSSEGYWFIHRLMSIRYIEQIYSKLSARYQLIELVTSMRAVELPKPNVNFNNIKLNATGTGLNHILGFLYLNSNIKLILVEPVVKIRYPSILNSPVGSFVKRLPGIVYRHIHKKIIQIPAMLKRKTLNLWVVQGGYDVAYLETHFPEAIFKNVSIKTILDVSKLTTQKADNELLEISKKFLITWFPKAHVWLHQLVENYLSNIIANLHEVEKKLKFMMECEKPDGVLYSLGANDPIDEMFARIANQLLIPVYFFKHGGVEGLFLKSSLLDSFFEKNPRIKRTQFIHSKLETVEYGNMPNIDLKMAGLLHRHDVRAKKNGRILFSAGPPSFRSLNDIYKMTLDSERYEFIVALLKSCDELHLKLDIKVHPAEWEVQLEFFKLILMAPEYKNLRGRVKLIVGGSIERIYSHYDLVILDLIPSRVLSGLLYTDKEIAVFVPDGIGTNQNTILDLESRVFVLKKPGELKSLLHAYKNKQLRRNVPTDFAQKYLGILNKKESIDFVKSSLMRGKP